MVVFVCTDTKLLRATRHVNMFKQQRSDVAEMNSVGESKVVSLFRQIAHQTRAERGIRRKTLHCVCLFLSQTFPVSLWVALDPRASKRTEKRAACNDTRFHTKQKKRVVHTLVFHDGSDPHEVFSPSQTSVQRRDAAVERRRSARHTIGRTVSPTVNRRRDTGF